MCIGRFIVLVKFMVGLIVVKSNSHFGCMKMQDLLQIIIEVMIVTII